MVVINDVPENRKEFDRFERATRREALLRQIGPRRAGLLVWHYGAGGESRSPAEIPVAKIEEYVQKYA
jgi:hypothetical protein